LGLEKKSCQIIIGKKKKFWLILISTIKIVDFSVNEFYSIRKILLGCSLTLPFLKIVDLSSRNIFYSGWLWVFELIFGLFEVINRFIKVFKMFSRFFG
jgi:hypothetical protein